MDSSALSILPPRVRVPSTPSMLFSIYIVQIVYLSFELECGKNEKINKKRPELAHFLKNKNKHDSLVGCSHLEDHDAGLFVEWEEAKVKSALIFRVKSGK